MKKFSEKLRPIILLSVFIYGAIGVAYIAAYLGIMRLWVVECADFNEFWCALSSSYFAIAIAALLFFALGKWLFVSWLKLVTTKQLAIGTLTLLVLLALKEWSVTQYWTVSESGQYNSVLFDILVNYGELFIILITSVVTLYSGRLFTKKKSPAAKDRPKKKK